jgi:uncharacterized protein
LRSSVVVCLAAVLLGVTPSATFARAADAPETTREERNRALVGQAFARWAAGTGDVFSLLADDVVWHITGFDPAVAKTYRGRQALLDATVQPLRARLTGPIKPTVKRIWADGDDVLVHWDGAATVYDGSPYRNTYLWVLTVRDQRVAAVTAFLDNAAFKAVLDKPAP